MKLKKILYQALPFIYMIILSLEYQIQGYAIVKIIINICFIVILIGTRIKGEKSDFNYIKGLLKICVLIGLLLAVTYLVCVGKEIK